MTGSEDCTVAVWGLSRERRRRERRACGGDDVSTVSSTPPNVLSKTSGSSPMSSMGTMSNMAALSSLTSSQSGGGSGGTSSDGGGVGGGSGGGSGSCGSGDAGIDARGMWRPIIPYPLLVLHGHDAPVTSVSVSCDLGVIISASEDGTAIVYSLTDGAYIRTLGKSSIYKSPDIGAFSRQRVVVGRDDSSHQHLSSTTTATSPSLLVADATSGVSGFASVGIVTWVGVTAEGGNIVLYFGDDMLLRVYTLNGKLVGETEIYERLHALIFSEDGKYLVTGGTSRVVTVRDICCSMTVVRKINGSVKPTSLMSKGMSKFESSIHSLSLTPKERHLIVGLGNGCMRIVALNAQYLRDRLQERLSSLGF